MGTNLGDLLKARGFEASGNGPEPEPVDEGALFAPKVVVRVTRKGRGGKTVTVIQGVLRDHASTAKTLKKTLGTGARVEGEEIVVQGDQRDRVADWLEAQGVKKVVRA